MNAHEIITATIDNATTAIRNAEKRLLQFTDDYAEADILIQIIKDNKRFIGEQRHTLSLMNDGAI